MSRCGICSNILDTILIFGDLPFANALIDTPQDPYPTYRAAWGWCESCQLFQLEDPPSASEMFTALYPYRTSSSQSSLQHFRRTAEKLTNEFGLDQHQLVVELGISDGGMIQFLNTKKLGFEPSQACWPELDRKGIPYLGWFDEVAPQILPQPAGLVYAANTLRSIPDIEKMLRTIHQCLIAGGALVIEEPYLLASMLFNEFDQFYNENVYCLTATSMTKLAEQTGFVLTKIEWVDIHGGGLRYYLEKKPANIRQPTAELLMNFEGNLPYRLREWGGQINRTLQSFRGEVEAIQKRSQPIVGYGATAKSSTVLNVAGIHLECIYDTIPAKHYKFMPGVNIPIINADEFANDDVDCVVLLAWNHAREIISRENAIRSRKWLTYAPNGIHWL